FSQPELLQTLGAHRLSRLLSDFTADLLECKLTIPHPDSTDYLTALASAFSDPASLPGRLREALMAIEKVALPEHSEWVRSELAQLAPCVSFPYNCPLLDLVLEIWFVAPAHLLRFASSLPELGEPNLCPSTPPDLPDAEDPDPDDQDGFYASSLSDTST